ncbi:hypothetical protein PV08_08981 [Exophiala spinifera]|uniref:Zn(2)-C6 fungal-type domain-containing protein n=1 Tax=Exophiala spinifera TaxID=91928 RepID=A0A0D2BRA5_9EURO|nr:uncharacterized protein PV08_08981 [Exophiala spinifera]KIW13789.1 hypothetical protein PV08_08981 [Exophiala spinifera]
MSVVDKNAKSRSGCRTCKQRRVKCDETKPSCQQCVLRDLECPGYEKRWKWSTKHEKPRRRNSSQVVSRPSRKNSSKATTLCDAGEVIPFDPELRNVAEISSESDKMLAPSLSSVQLAAGTLRSPPSARRQQDDQSSPPHKLDLIPGQSSTDVVQRTQAVSHYQSVWQSPDTVLGDPQGQVEYFTQKICRALTAFDSNYNQFRSVGGLRIKESLLYFSLCRYLTAAFLNSSDFEASNALVVQNAQTEILYRLQTEVAQLDISQPAKLAQVLMAVIMYGLAANWDGSNSPSKLHYHAAVRMYRHMYHPDNIPAARSATATSGGFQEFFAGCLLYWWMGLAFVSDTIECPLHEPPSWDCLQQSNLKFIPHPLVGVSPSSQRLLGQVGLLVHEQRLRCRRNAFVSMGALQKEFRAWQEAQELEEQALSLELPEAADFVDTGDPHTPIEDLINTAEVYRLSALVLLYRAFPDLLTARLTSNQGDAGDGTVGNYVAEQKRLSWITALAVHALETLCRNGARSGTRSIEQILLIIIAGELRKPPATISISQSCETSSDPIFQTPDAEPLSDSTHFQDEGASLLCEPPPDAVVEPLDQGAFSGGTPEAASVEEARSTLLRRLESICELLPYRSTELVKDLVLTVWARTDREGPEVFWMDIMIEKGWDFLVV